MKQQTDAKIKLGIFVALGLFLFIAGIYYIGSKQNIFGNTFKISGLFKNVNGLQVGNNVRFSGINVGTVTSLEIVSDSTVRVHFIIQEKIRKFIKKDAIAIVSSESLMGNKVVVIGPGSAGEQIVENGDIIKSQNSIEIDDILKSLKATAEYSEIITSDMALIVERINSGQGITGKLLSDSMMGINLASMISNISEGTAEFNTNMAAFKHTINNALKITDNTSLITHDLAKITNRLNAGEGMAGKLLMDTVLSDYLSKAIINVEQGTREFNENMMALKNFFLFKRYFQNKERKKEKEKKLPEEENYTDDPSPNIEMLKN